MVARRLVGSRPENREHHPASRVASDTRRHKGLRAFLDIKGSEGSMATRRQDQIVETPTEARQAEPGPSVLALLTVSTGLAVLILGVVWFVFFRT
jgi:hypothetical protein